MGDGSKVQENILKELLLQEKSLSEWLYLFMLVDSEDVIYLKDTLEDKSEFIERAAIYKTLKKIEKIGIKIDNFAPNVSD